MWLTALKLLGPPSNAMRKRWTGLKRAGGDDHGLAAGADDALEVRAEMKLGEVGGFAALSDDDEVGIRFEFVHGLDQIAMAQLGRDLGDAGSQAPGPWLDQDGAAALLGQLGLLLVEGSEFGEQIVARHRLRGCR